jgi:putative DNA primase/helicase
MTDNIALDAVAIEQDEKATIAGLAKLSPLQYDRQRSRAAEELGVSVSALDKAVKGAKASDADTKGQGRPLELPDVEPWGESVNGAELLDDICKAIQRYVVLPEGSADVMALWALHTHVFDCFNHSPRLAITSPEKGCGKTTALDVLRELVSRPLSTSNVTVSAVFRTIEIVSPTLLIDEADTFLKENEELRGILNSGHRKGTPIIRTVGDDYEPRQFSTWSPAAIAMIGNLPSTLDDRSIAVRLRRRKPTERVETFRSDRAIELHVLARKAARWGVDHQATLLRADPDMGELINRAADNWRPLFAIADLAGGKWPKHARTIAQSAEAEKEDQSVRTMLLSDIGTSWLIARRATASARASWHQPLA